MPTKAARFGLTRVYWRREHRLTAEQCRNLRELADDERFVADVEALAAWYRDERDFHRDNAISPREVELSLSATAKDARALADDRADDAGRVKLFVRLWQRLASLSPSCSSFILDAAVAYRMQWPPRFRGLPADRAGVPCADYASIAALLQQAAAGAASVKSPAAKRGAWLEREAAVRLREIFRANGMRFTLTRTSGRHCAAVEALAIVIPAAARATLERYVQFAVRAARLGG
jgi:hypothetical protein